MSGIVDKDGKPVEKKWDEMDLDGKLNVLRLGIGALINQGNAVGVAMARLMKALDESAMQPNADLASPPVPSDEEWDKLPTKAPNGGLDQVPE